MNKIAKNKATSARSSRGASSAKDALRRKAPPETVSASEMESVLGYMLRRAQVSVFQQFMNELSYLNIRPTQIGVLSVIRENPGRKQAEISAALGIQRTNFVAIFDELERRGLAKRMRVENDHRAYALYLTDKGQELVTHWVAEQRKLEDRLAEIVGGSAIYKQTMRTLAKLAKLQDEDLS